MKRILVTGAYGFLGQSLCESLEAAGHVVFRQGRKRCAQLICDPSVPGALSAAIAECAPDVLINLIAKVDVEGCEIYPDAAFEANVQVVESIVSALAGHNGIHLIHLSSDHLYCGPGPSAEDHAVPINVYAKTKYAGEQVASKINATVLRTNFVGRSVMPGQKSLSDWIVEKLAGREPFTVFRDVLFSPLHVSTVCRYIERAAVMQKPGTYNLGARGGISKAEFAVAFAKLLGADAKLMVFGDCADTLQSVKRPCDMTMSVCKFEEAFACELPSIQNELQLLARDYGASKS